MQVNLALGYSPFTKVLNVKYDMNSVLQHGKFEQHINWTIGDIIRKFWKWWSESYKNKMESSTKLEENYNLVFHCDFLYNSFADNYHGFGYVFKNRIPSRAGSCASELQLKVNCRPKVNCRKESGWSANCWPSQPKFYPTIHLWSTVHFQLQFTCTWSDSRGESSCQPKIFESVSKV